MNKKRSALSVALMTVLVGCGGGGGGGGGVGGGGSAGGPAGGGSEPVAALTGQFIDAPVAGLRYVIAPTQVPCAATAAGCVTDENGTFEYNEGDVVTFMVGAQTLGTVPAQGVVTPQTVAEAIVAGNPESDPETVRDNILVFLQSLDADGDPSNGITIAPEVSAAIAASAVDFTAGEADFDAAFAAVMAGIESASGRDLMIVARRDAVAHFAGQLAARLRGTFVGADASFSPVLQNMRTLTFFGDRTYLYGGHDGNPCDEDIGVAEDGADGVEVGTFEYDPETGALTFQKAFDTNGCSGPETGEGEYWQTEFDGSRLKVTLVDADGVQVLDDLGEPDIAHFVRVASGNGTAAGAWLLPHAALNGMPVVLTVFPDANPASGRYFLADARRHGLEGYEGLNAGIEEGCYTVDASGMTAFTASPGSCAAAVDTNGDDGFNGNVAQMTVDSHGRLSLVEGGGEHLVRFMPMNHVPYSLNDFAGAWILEPEPNAEPAGEEGLFVLVVDAGNGENGSFVFGTQHNHGLVEAEEECAPPGYPLALGMLAEGANGVEAGVFQLTSDTGAVMPLIEEGRGIDTNGECGMFDAAQKTSGRPSAHMLRKSREAGALIWWTNHPLEEEGVVFRRITSVAGSEIGLWQHGTPAAPRKEYALFLPGGQVFSIRHESSEDSGIRRERYSVNGDEIVVSGSGFAQCVDTIDHAACAADERGWSLGLDAERRTATLAGGTMFKLTQ